MPVTHRMILKARMPCGTSAPVGAIANQEICTLCDVVRRLRRTDDVEKLASAKIDSMYEYTFPCKKGYEEHIYLVKQQYLIYEVDGVLFLATKKSK